MDEGQKPGAYRLPMLRWQQCSDELRKAAHDIQWSGLVDLDIDIYESIQAEVQNGVSRQGLEEAKAGLTPGRQAWLATKVADMDVADGGLLGLYSKCADRSGYTKATAGYRLLNEWKLAERLERVAALAAQEGSAAWSTLHVKQALEQLDNSSSDGSLGRLRYAVEHPDEFFA